MFRKPPPGAAPGALAPPPDTQPTRVHVIDYTAERLDEHDVESVDELAVYHNEQSVTWVDVQGLSDIPVLQRIAEIFTIHPLALADIVNVPQRPKVDEYDHHSLWISRMVMIVQPPLVLDVDQLSIVLGRGWVLTFQERYGDVLDPVRNRIRGGAALRRMGADHLAYSILDTAIDGYYPVLEAIGEYLETLEDALIHVPRPDTMHRLHAVRRSLIDLRRAMWPQRDAINVLIRDSSPFIGETVRPYLRDSYDHAVQISEVLETQRELSAALMEVYLSNVGNRTNEVMKVLTVVATIFIPLTFLVGVYGMNFDVMPELHIWWAYPALWAVMIALALGMLGYFRHLGWLGASAPPRPDEVDPDRA